MASHQIPRQSRSQANSVCDLNRGDWTSFGAEAHLTGTQDNGVHWQQSNQLPPESEINFSDELLPALDGGIGLCFDQTPLEDLTFGCPDLAADNFELDHIHASSLDSLSQQEVQRYSHSDGFSPYNLQRAFSTSSLANQELSETDTSTNPQYPAIPITPNSTLPRRRSRYSLRHTLNGGRSIYIPVYDASEQASEPLQRWRNSPPETESASCSFHQGGIIESERGQLAQSIFKLNRFYAVVSIVPESKQEKPRIFHCTFCCDSFSKKHDWTRHEKTLHLDCDQWICAPYGGAVVSSSTGRSTCAYCNILDPTENHLNSHNHNACHNGQQPHIFRRKDNLIQHLRGFHQLDTLPILDDWRIPPPPISSRCGFCDQHLASWQDRADHLTQHFRQGKTMAEWKGDHNFEPSIAAQVRNALPPYLLANEALTMRREGKNLPDPEQQLDPGFDLTPDSYTKFLAWHLGRFAQQSFASGVFPTDEMFQGEARRLFYGSDDKWEQTIADNEQWIATFRRQHLSKD
ncbi:Zinc finger C2H2-type [Fusarium oxysporum f. sp. vasinfectum]|nr:Zinc finger C2H2-type [Fusarium oxysporum f. sp. vasinfectum]